MKVTEFNPNDLKLKAHNKSPKPMARLKHSLYALANPSKQAAATVRGLLRRKPL
jgi:hypothetical protein